LKFDLSTCIGFVTDTAIKSISEEFNRRLEKQGSTRIQWVAMYFLAEAKNPMSQKELAIRLNITDPTLARLVDRMERDQLITRIESKEDKRVKFLELTPEGEAKIEELMPAGQEFSELLLKEISQEELRVFEGVIEKMLKNIR